MALNGPGQMGSGRSSDYDGHGSPSDDKFNGILKNLGNTSLKQTKDGQEPKKRGPKPDSKPALTRRQELNRQAQRTHRERKEQYTKALESEVIRLRDLYGVVVRDRDSTKNELDKLKAFLAANGITPPIYSPAQSHSALGTSYDDSTGGSINGSRGQDSNTTGMTSPSSVTSPVRSPHQMNTGYPHLANSRLDLNQIGIDFVLTLERPCMEHMQYLVVRSHNAEGQPFHHPMERADDVSRDHMCGHALMATCPPMTHIMNKPGEQYPHQMPMMPPTDLMRLFEASGKLPIEGGEVTPVRAWMMVLQSEQLPYLGKKDFELIKNYLSDKVRCYGFGAVLEEFEVLDALHNVMENREMAHKLGGMGHDDGRLVNPTEVMV